MKNITITDFKEIEEIIESVPVCHVAFVDGNLPYVLPFNFGYENKTLFLHSAKTGKKLDIIRKNNNVCISLERDSVLNIRQEEVACSYSMKFKSVIITGKVEFVLDFNEKCRIMNVIMKHYTNRDDFSYNPPAIDNVEVMKINISEVSARKRGY